VKLTTLSHLVTTLRSSEATVTFPNTLQGWQGDSVFLLVLLLFEELGWIHLTQNKDHQQAFVDTDINVWLLII
jgi:hypothetical protein